MGVCLTSCGQVSHDPSEYVLKLNYSKDYRILQLTDTHIGDKDNTKLHYDFMDLTVKDALRIQQYLLGLIPSLT